MKRNLCSVLLGVLILIGSHAFIRSQGTLEDYQRAERFLPDNVEELVFRLKVDPYWIDKSSRFWYQVRTRYGKEFILVDQEKKTKEPAFNQDRLAASLSKALGKQVEPGKLPFDRFEFIEKGQAIEFKIGKEIWRCHLTTYECQKIGPEGPEDPSESKSPDGKWVAFVKDFNFYVRSTASGEEFQLTTDGQEKYDYGTTVSWYKIWNESRPEEEKPQIFVNWAPDSKKLVTCRLDRKKAKKLYLLQSMPEEGFRAIIYSYERTLPGDAELTKIEYVIFNVENKKKISVDLEPFPSFLSTGLPHWFKDSSRLHLVKMERGYQEAKLLEIEAATGAVRTILEEHSDTNIDPYMIDMRMIGEGAEVLWTSERDGFSHVYLFDGKTGQLKTRITRGEYGVRRIVHVDEKARVVYFIASGQEQGRDPYYQHLYRVKLDGSDLKLLTLENAEHEIYFSPDGKYFVDNYSRVDLAPSSLLRESSSGKTAMELEKADISDLLATGWTFPQPFQVKARDGKTDVYGVIFLSSQFDPQKKYPVIDSSYSGPHTFRTPKSFYRGYRNSEQPIAELGFIVVALDGLGSAARSKEFHNFSYKNLGDIGAQDHIEGIKQLAERCPYMDLSRVGIYGHSAGGYDAAHALLTHPEFYKVAVSSAGNHDHRMAKAWWPELWMGFPVGEHYDQQSNLTLAKNLQGKLLLVHGDMDNNVNPACTLRLAGELIKANKDFDLLIIPNQDHDLGSHPYFIRKRWDYFVRYLLRVEPPEEYQISLPKKKNRSN